LNKNIDYILDSVIERGFDKKSNDCNDFAVLLYQKDFKELIAMELYESYFWEERHEFDIQILREIVETVSKLFTDPDTIMQIKTGFLQNLPTAMIIGLLAYIKQKISKVKNKEAELENSSWHRIETNIKKIDKKFFGHDYILTDEIESVFDAKREEIQPLLKLCGFKCYFDKKRSIWIKVGLPDCRVKEILKKNRFKFRR
jgi:hypothetical protein